MQRCEECHSILTDADPENPYLEHAVECSIGEMLEQRIVDAWIDEAVHTVRKLDKETSCGTQKKES